MMFFSPRLSGSVLPSSTQLVIYPKLVPVTIFRYLFIMPICSVSYQVREVWGVEMGGMNMMFMEGGGQGGGGL